ncbi:protein-(glutamine-N5) methyltransferase, release factor-specific [Candidatus Endobugula sertula]|uniref:Release factor glutamine methyltransferase n=1 Tax=Candidatus Endobugula sertula TaxID=62101 RepID=A0A1D2QMX6_9GAMM|nr:protein-(glutamine-N5) methyltransferase, release factor-specific [Candidatus Endobugula sertula]
MLSIADALKRSKLLVSMSDTARLDIEVLLSAVLQKSRAYLYTWPENHLSQAQESLFNHYLQQRQQGQPIAYIVGSQEFWSLTLLVNNSTLIPRPETELLVETVLALFSQDQPGLKRTAIDLGTGTGAIALALATEKKHWQITAIDSVADACALAESNRQQHQLDNVTVLRSDWLQVMGEMAVDVIVSNPPYIDSNDPHLFQGDVRFEPRSALIAADNGLADIVVICQQASQHLLPEGWLLIEHGYQQAEAVSSIFLNNGFMQVETRKDMVGHERITLGQWLPPKTNKQ